ncbi:MAG: arginine deiminase-related protein [Chitinophagales bacterium]
MKTNERQATDTLLMIRPSRFGFNAETASSNIFQSIPEEEAAVQTQALKEFDLLVKKLRGQKIYIIALQDRGTSRIPDSIFPNNWISFHSGTMILYPMLAENRRAERREDWIAFLKQTFGVWEVKNFSSEELNGNFLEGTGSMVLDRINKIAYAGFSSRTNPALFQQWCNMMNFEAAFFTARIADGNEIYHTNVLMSIGERVAVLCSEVIRDAAERKKILKKLSEHREVIEITEHQMMHFAGNLLLVKNREGRNFWVLSDQAFNSLSIAQKELLKQDGDFICSDLKSIESTGGGSARCMIAEIF